MSQTTWLTQAIWEGTSLRVMARVRDINAAYITQASISTVKYRCVADGVQIVALTTLTKTAVIFDTLQTPASWTIDAIGYNFMYIFPPATFPNGGVTYYVPIEFTDTGGNVSVLGVKAETAETYLDTPA